MSQRRRVWFEDAGQSLDPGLVEILWNRRKEDPEGKNSSPIPVVISLKKDFQQEQKENLMRICQEVPNSLEAEFRMIHAVNGRLHPETIRQLLNHEAVSRIYYDREVTSLLDVSARGIGAVKVQEQEGFTGNGVTIAIIDTGIHPHPDLTQPTNRIVAFQDFVNGRTVPYDDNGHGTHCAGDAAGNGSASNGQYRGPAPEASLVGVKVLDQQGSGRLSTIIQGIEWCVDHRDEYNIRIISLSLGAPAFEPYREDPLAQAAQEAWFNGIVVCAAAGNSGPYPMTISTPGINPYIITVGATDDVDTIPRSDDEIARYSSRGPTIDALIKPDIYSPGTDIISLLAPGSALEKQLPEQHVGEFYLQLSGTSMATPICAGVAALMLEANPYLSPNDVKSLLQVTAQHELNDQWGYIEAQSAVNKAKNTPHYEPKLHKIGK